ISFNNGSFYILLQPSPPSPYTAAALKYQALLDDLHQKQLQVRLSELYLNEQDINAIVDKLRERQHQAAARNTDLVSWEQMVKVHKKEHGRLSRELQLLEKEIRGQEQLLSQSRSQFIKAKVNTSHRIKKVEGIRDAAKKSQKLLAVKKQEVEEHRQRIAELRRTWKNSEKPVMEEKGRDIELDKDQLERYRELKQWAQKEGAVLNQQAEKLHWEVRADGEKMAFDQRRKKELEVPLTFANPCVCVLSQYGRLSSLCSPIHKKYQLAVTKVFGGNMNAIVVSSEKVARECIVFIKEERAEPEMFLPVDYLVVNPLNERLRDIPGAKMVVDVVQVNAGSAAAQLRKVVQYVCGNALVCETMKEARRIAFEGEDRVRTVTLDGTLFKTSGVISGGSSALRSKARCWNEQDMMHLKKHREDLMKELHGLMRMRRKESDLKEVTAQAQGAQTRLKYTKIDLENLQKKTIPKCQSEISRMESELANLDYQIQMQQKSLEGKNEEMKRIRHQIDQIEDKVFSGFCAEIGVVNIREYEQGHLKEQAEVDKKRLEVENHCARLNAQLEYEENQLEQERKKLCKMEESISEEEKNMNKLEVLKNQLLFKKSQVSTGKAELDQKSQTLEEINKAVVKLQREVMSAETALEQKRLARHNLLLACKIHDLPVILLSGSLNEISELVTDSESTLATMDIYEREAQLIIDYSELDEDLMTAEEIEAYMEKLKESLSSLEVVLHRTTAPNLKALEKMNEVKDKLQGVTEAFDASTTTTRRCNQEFEQVKAQRFHLFSCCFEHVSVVIDQIYKKICRNSSAQAILTAENSDEPYLGGINFSCVAPGKRFMSMENLSGGEKAIASLALLFAIHSFCPAPFLILDEVDAALDNTNIGKVTSFLREESRQNTQIIVISLKEEFFSKADALVGVYSTVSNSHVLTLDLRPYPLVEEGNGNNTGENREHDSCGQE
uniref:Structural maintenance of chromosomes 1B n=1 Tax=Nothobranchius furzeri TaxID=105023 RepID=A0A8C6KVW8_NOTFU